MTDPSLQQIRRHITLTVVLSVGLVSFVCAQESTMQPALRNALSAPGTSPDKENILTAFQEQAKFYREQGLRQQKMGKWQEALSFYQKAIELDPAYAAAYNDLGVVFETMGSPERAEESYQTAVAINPRYADAYTNLALLYESKRELKKAAYCWKKRSELGSPSDPWTKKSKKRYNDVRVLLGEADLSELEVMKLTDSMVLRKGYMDRDNKTLSEGYFEFAQQSFKRHDYVRAMKYATDALLLDSSNREINDFIEQLQMRILAK